MFQLDNDLGIDSFKQKYNTIGKNGIGDSCLNQILSGNK